MLASTLPNQALRLHLSVKNEMIALFMLAWIHSHGDKRFDKTLTFPHGLDSRLFQPSKAFCFKSLSYYLILVRCYDTTWRWILWFHFQFFIQCPFFNGFGGQPLVFFRKKKRGSKTIVTREEYSDESEILRYMRGLLKGLITPHDVNMITNNTQIHFY